MAFPVRKRFACSPLNVAAARTFATAAVAGLDLEPDTAELLVSELATNAVRHAGTPFVVGLCPTPTGLRIEVADESALAPSQIESTDEGGFGLGILEAVAHSWGFERHDGGKVVWCELLRVGTEPDRKGHGQPVEPVSGGPSAQPTYSIGAVSRLLGVAASTLRAWEARYGVVVPVRSEGGQRLYSRDQIDLLRFVLAQVATGMKPAEAHQLLEQRVESVTFVPSGPGAPTLILVADRDHYSADLAEYFLRTEGFEVRIVLDGEDGRRLLEEESPDLAILDLLLPGAPRELCRRLSAAAVPVLALSSLQMRDAAMEAGASAFLAKPLEPLQLISTVRDLLGTSALGRATRQKGERDLTHH